MDQDSRGTRPISRIHATVESQDFYGGKHDISADPLNIIDAAWRPGTEQAIFHETDRVRVPETILPVEDSDTRTRSSTTNGRRIFDEEHRLAIVATRWRQLLLDLAAKTQSPTGNAITLPLKFEPQGPRMQMLPHGRSRELQSTVTPHQGLAMAKLPLALPLNDIAKNRIRIRTEYIVVAGDTIGEVGKAISRDIGHMTVHVVSSCRKTRVLDTTPLSAGKIVEAVTPALRLPSNTDEVYLIFELKPGVAIRVLNVEILLSRRRCW